VHPDSGVQGATWRYVQSPTKQRDRSTAVQNGYLVKHTLGSGRLVLQLLSVQKHIYTRPARASKYPVIHAIAQLYQAVN
jgi:hypothetical protein